MCDTSMVKSQVEYDYTVWEPSTQCNINETENLYGKANYHQQYHIYDSAAEMGISTTT